MNCSLSSQQALLEYIGSGKAARREMELSSYWTTDGVCGEVLVLIELAAEVYLS